MEIDRYNYEVFFIDYFDHVLNPQEVAELLIFLEENPDIKEEFENFEHIVIPYDSDIVFPLKNNLKRTNNAVPFSDNDIIAFLEGDLDSESSKNFTFQLNNDPSLQIRVNTFKNTYLTPDESIFLNNKNNLKRHGLVPIVLKISYFAISVAAVVFIALGLINFFSQNSQEKVAKVNGLKKTKNPFLQVYDSIPEGFITPKAIRMASSNTKFTSAPGYLPLREPIAAIHPVVILKAGYISMDSLPPFSIAHREQFVLLYEYIILREMEWSAEQSFMGRFLASAFKKLLPFKSISSQDEQNKSFVSLMVKGYGIMTDKDIDYSEITDKSGQIVAYSLNGDRVEFSRIKRHFQKDSDKEE